MMSKSVLVVDFSVFSGPKLTVKFSGVRSIHILKEKPIHIPQCGITLPYKICPKVLKI